MSKTQRDDLGSSDFAEGLTFLTPNHSHVENIPIKEMPI